MPRSRSRTPADVAAAALAVVDRDGLAALTMRSVAAELGMGTMSLYRYVEDREHLERLIIDTVLGPLDLTLPASLPWCEYLSILIGRLRAAVGRHPSVVPLVVAHRHECETVLRWSEVVLGVLTAAGFEGERRVIAFRTLLSYTIGVLQYQQLGSLTGPGTEILANLPDNVYPLLAATASDARRISSDDEFCLGLEAVLRGIQAVVEATPAHRGRGTSRVP